MTVKEIKEGMTAPEVAQTIKDNFDALNTEKETVGNVGKVKESVDNANKNTGVSNYPAFSATEDVAVGVVRNYNGLLYRSIVAGANEWNEANWERVSLESLQNEKLTELASYSGITASIPMTYSDSKNICGAECIDKSEYKYILWTDGSVLKNNSVSSNYSTLMSYPFPVDWTKGYVTISGHIFDAAMGYRFFDIKGDIVGYGKMATENSEHTTIAIPTSAAYMQITLINTKIVDYNNLQVEYGSDATSFERYRGSVNNEYAKQSFLQSNALAEIIEENTKNIYSQKNVIDKYQYIDIQNGSIASIAHTLKITNPIPIKQEEGFITISTAEGANQLSKSNGYRILGANFNVLSYGPMSGDTSKDTSTNTIILPLGASFIQFTVRTDWRSTDFQAEYGKEATEHVRYSGNTIGDINYKSLSVFGLASNTKNICGIECFDVRKYQYIYPDNGSITTANAQQYGLITTYPIVVNSDNGYLTISGIKMGNHAIYRFLDKNGNSIEANRLGSNDNVVIIKTISIPNKAVFFQLSNLISDLSDNLQVEYGSEATTFERYSGVYSHPDNSDEKQAINLKEITIAKGKEKAYYFNGMSILPIGEKQIFRHAYAKCYDRFFVFNEDSLSSQLSEKQYGLDVSTNKLSVNEREVYNIPMNVFDASARAGKSINILCVGDSFTNMGIWNTGMQVLAKKDGITINSIGLMQGDYTDSGYPAIKCNSEYQSGGTLFNSFMQDRFANNFGGRSYKVSVSGLQQELDTTYSNNTLYQDSNGTVWAVSGKKIVNGDGFLRLTAAYSNQRENQLASSGSLNKLQGVGDSTLSYTLIEEVNRNPFWNPSTNKVDFKYYIETWGFDTPDVLIFMFGWNDIYAWGTVPSAQYIVIDEFCNNIIAFITQFKSDYPTSKAIFSIPTYGKSDIGVSYFTTGVKYTRQNLYEKLYEYYKNDDSVSIVPSYMSVDDVLAFDMEETTPIKRYPNETITIATDEVHNNTEGMLQISDAIYPYLLKYI